MLGNLFKQFGGPELTRSTRIFWRKKVHLPNLGLRFSERKLLLTLGDLTMLNGALVLYLVARAKFNMGSDNFWNQLPWFVVLSGLWLAVSIFWDVYDLKRAAQVMESISYTAVATIFVTGLYLLIPYLTPTLPNRRLFIFLLPILASFNVSVWRTVYATLLSQPTFQRRAIIIGAGESGRALVQMVAAVTANESSTVYNLVGFVDDDVTKLEQLCEGVPVLGTHQDLLALVTIYRPDELILAVTQAHLIQASLLQTVLSCRELGIPITTMTHLYESLTGRVPVKYAGNDLQVVLPIDRPASHRLYLVIRRSLELLIALVGCLFLLCFVPFIWLANRIASPAIFFIVKSAWVKGARYLMSTSSGPW
jgi:hypothetical protein